MNKNKINIVVISLFNGCSCGRLALDKVENLSVLRYYSSEIDKFAIKVADKNYPQDVAYKLGDVKNIDSNALLSEIKKDFPHTPIMLIGGSPCQGFSTAGKMKGSCTIDNVEVTSLKQYLYLKEKGFEFHGQSYLFWEYVRIKEEIQPDVFFLENVRVTKKWIGMFNEAMGVEPTRMNSSLLSAQNRDRYYWHNLGEIPQPKDKGLIISDILDYSIEDNIEQNIKIGAWRGRYLIDGKRQDGKMKTAGLTTQRLEVRKDEKSNCLTTAQKDNVLVRPCSLRKKEVSKNAKCHHIATATDIRGNDSIKRVYAKSGKSPTVTTCTGGNCEPKVLVQEVQENNKMMVFKANESISKNQKSYCLTARYGGAVAWNSCQRKQRSMVVVGVGSDNPNAYNGLQYRKLTPLECERLQTMPDNFTSCVSNSQRYKMIGNGWTIDVITYFKRTRLSP